MVLVDSLIDSLAFVIIAQNGFSILRRPDHDASMGIVVVDAFSVLISEGDRMDLAGTCTPGTRTRTNMHSDSVVGPSRYTTGGVCALNGPSDRLHCDDVRFLSWAGRS